MAFNKLSLSEKLAEKTIRQGACLIWTGMKDHHGYGMVKLAGRMQRAHRLMYGVHHGEIPDGLVVMHSCDNPSCVEISHLSAGTQRDNIDDMVEKGRSRRLLGEMNPKSKFTRDQISEIRRRFIKYDRVHGAAPMAREFSVSKTAILDVIHRKNWSHAAP